MDASSHPAASVVVPTRNRATRLALTLRTLLQQTTDNFEVVVVNDGSTDQTAELLARASLDWGERLIVVETPLAGRAVARNAGLAHCNGEIAIFCDDDRLAAPDLVGAHLALHSRSQGLVVLGWQRATWTIVEPELWPVAPPAVQQELVRCPTTTMQLSWTKDTARVPPALQEEEPFFRDWVLPVFHEFGETLTQFALPWSLGTTANLSVDRDSIAAVGGFDEGFRGWGLEDTELHLRLHLAGLKTVLVPHAVNYHQCHVRPATNSQEWCRNAQHFLAKHPLLEAQMFVGGVLAGASLLEMHAALTSGDVLPPRYVDALRQAGLTAA